MAESGIKIEKKDDVFHISGSLDEFAEFDSVLAENGPVTFDLSGVTRINSIGIRNYLKFLNQWGDKGLSYQNVPSAFVDQINMIPALLGANTQAQVESLYLPFQCSKCDHEADILSDLKPFKDSFQGKGTLAQPKCPKCQSDMNLFTDAFFAFLDH